MENTKNIIGEYFAGYGAAVAQSRALISVEDGLKPSLRQALYANFTDKFVGSKKKAKFVKLIGSASRFCWHGDMSTYGMMIRCAKPFAMRYPLYGAQGSYGTLIDPGNHAHQRYVEGYLSDIGASLFNSIKCNTIPEWKDNYDDTEKYPLLLPSRGFWNVCNGTLGIGTGLAASIPSFNLKEMNEALSKYLLGEPFDLPMPDFATGGVLLNSNEVKEALEKGSGGSCKLRAKIDYDEKTRTFTVCELPYATYTNTICKELEVLLEDPANGIETFIDVTGEQPNIQITVKKTANPAKVLEVLWQKTSLQNNYGINLTMLQNSRYPKVFSLREAMWAHLEHELAVYKRECEYNLQVILDRLVIVEGYLLAFPHIEEIVSIVKKSSTREQAASNLVTRFKFLPQQVAAILKLTLGKLSHLDQTKYEEEKKKLLVEKTTIEDILASSRKQKENVAKELRRFAAAHGDNRRTVLTNVEEETADKLAYFTADGKIRLSEPKSGTTVGTMVSGQPYLLVSYKGVIYRSAEYPKRQKQVANLAEGDYIIAVFPDDNKKFLTVIDEEKHFRCKEIAKLNATRTSLSLTNLKEVHITSERTTKVNYKDIVKKQ